MSSMSSYTQLSTHGVEDLIADTVKGTPCVTLFAHDGDGEVLVRVHLHTKTYAQAQRIADAVNEVLQAEYEAERASENGQFGVGA